MRFESQRLLALFYSLKVIGRSSTPMQYSHSKFIEPLSHSHREASHSHTVDLLSLSRKRTSDKVDPCWRGCIRVFEQTSQPQTPRTSGRARSTSTIQSHAISRISGPLSIEQCSIPPSSGPKTTSFYLAIDRRVVGLLRVLDGI